MCELARKFQKRQTGGIELNRTTEIQPVPVNGGGKAGFRTRPSRYFYYDNLLFSNTTTTRPSPYQTTTKSNRSWRMTNRQAVPKVDDDDDLFFQVFLSSSSSTSSSICLGLTKEGKKQTTMINCDFPAAIKKWLEDDDVCLVRRE